ncbi:glutamate-5-semialdehyde dehydrogenase [Algisphaera agarilytica]|uniref:Gamma-glutamyl phosphate reductase n=1 Tax=Algisphaera agarilytica TaxID=1385975 RepID=A0A7X0H3S1_9BACT|nr:glutamate-5-semialdehyde dehydrogenase [Algisphaera agarilytica]MBB6428548.1 glutamate-5-semialdehyde dehydrogenase [Algisphaera agarilytica]
MTTATPTADTTDVPAYCLGLAQAARAAGLAMATVPGSVRDDALRYTADALVAATETLKAANAKDLEAGRANGLASAMLDRLELNDDRIANMADAVRQIADQPDPVGRILEGRVLSNGIRLEKVRVPLGTVLIIFESRPNVTCDAAALCLKSGNAAILRGGKEALHSNAAIAACVKQGLDKAGVPADAVQLVGTTDRSAVGELLKLDELIDVCIPRGGESLIRAVVEQSRIPVIKHYTGNCHVYVDATADHDMAVDICLNAKTQRTGVCNATETILFHQDCVANGLVRKVGEALLAKGVELRADTRSMSELPDSRPAEESDWSAEYLDMIVALRVVDSLDDAVAHINRYGSKHTDAILTTDLAASNRFVQSVDTANVMVNCSTRFSDGQQYGLGAEIGISTDKLHSRGPMGAEDLTTYKWVARGDGQVRG